MTPQQIHFLQPGDRVRTTQRFRGSEYVIAAGVPGIVQIVIVALHLNDYQEVDAAKIKWRGGRIELLQSEELKRWVTLERKAVPSLS